MKYTIILQKSRGSIFHGNTHPSEEDGQRYHEGVQGTGSGVKPFIAWKEQHCLSLLHSLLEAEAYCDDSASEDTTGSNKAKKILWKLKRNAFG